MQVSVVPFAARYAGAFRCINLAWIRAYFVVEEHDRRVLADPEALVAAGGHILIAVAANAADAAVTALAEDDDTSVLGVLALLLPAAHGSVGMELAKMGVREGMRGKGVGRALGEAAVALARSLHVPRLDILSNRRLKPALALYASLGFVEQMLPPNDYERADIYLVLDLVNADTSDATGAAPGHTTEAGSPASASGQ